MVGDNNDSDNPLRNVDEYDQDVARRYPTPQTTAQNRSPSDFRDYSENTRDGVREFYYQNHTRQTVDFVRLQREKYLPLRHKKMGIWTAMEFLNELIDDSDPDIELPQIAHAMQTAEAIRAAGHPDWFIVTGLVHDMGKVLCLFGEPQWAVTGDTFPVGCRYSKHIVYHEFFEENPDFSTEAYQSRLGIYSEHCGLDKVMLSWGHDEYMYHVVRDYLPEEAQYMIRYHSFYPCHRDRDYEYLMNEHDSEMFRWVHKFNPFDLYTKSETPPDSKALLPYYEDLVAKFFPDEIWW